MEAAAKDRLAWLRALAEWEIKDRRRKKKIQFVLFKMLILSRFDSNVTSL